MIANLTPLSNFTSATGKAVIEGAGQQVIWLIRTKPIDQVWFGLTMSERFALGKLTLISSYIAYPGGTNNYAGRQKVRRQQRQLHSRAGQRGGHQFKNNTQAGKEQGVVFGIATICGEKKGE